MRAIETLRLYLETTVFNYYFDKDREGHQTTDKGLLAGYAYGRYWGRWNLKFQHVLLSNPASYQIVERDGT